VVTDDQKVGIRRRLGQPVTCFAEDYLTRNWQPGVHIAYLGYRGFQYVLGTSALAFGAQTRQLCRFGGDPLVRGNRAYRSVAAACFVYGPLQSADTRAGTVDSDDEAMSAHGRSLPRFSP
jgi:hypothetical protein